MWITHSYLGTTLGSARCLFFLLYEDYVETQSQFARELDRELERFARNLREQGVVARAFEGDVEGARRHVLDKPWSSREKAEVEKTPALLMIDQDFDAFDPRAHRWVVFHFGSRNAPVSSRDSGSIRSLLEGLSKAVADQKADPFKEAMRLRRETSGGGGDLLIARPGAFGFSVDLRVAGDRLLRFFKPPGHGRVDEQ